MSAREQLTYKGRTYSVRVEADECMGAPWKEHDGHGIIIESVTRAKRPGERLLSAGCFYDVQETMMIARRDGWGIGPEEATRLARRLKREPKAGDIIAEAVRLDFEHMRGWCNGDWFWVAVVVTGPDGEECSVGGVDGDGEYCRALALELAEQLHGEHMARRRQRSKEARERRYWACRGVETRA